MSSPTQKKERSERQLTVSLADALEDYMHNLNGQPCTSLYQSTLAIVEKQLLRFSLQKCNGNVSAATKMLGISRTTLTRKIAAHQLRIK